MPDGNVAVWLKLGGGTLADDLLDACDRLETADEEVVLDLSSVRRIDPAALAAIDQLAACADSLGVRVVLRGVNIEVYKVLKLTKLAPHFSFLN